MYSALLIGICRGRGGGRYSTYSKVLYSGSDQVMGLHVGHSTLQ